MQSPEQKPKQSIAITPEILTRANLLGMLLFVLFGVSTLITYLILGVFDWRDLVRVLVAMCIGPMIVIILFGIWYNMKKPEIFTVTTSSTSSDKPSQNEID